MPPDAVGSPMGEPTAFVDAGAGMPTDVMVVLKVQLFKARRGIGVTVRILPRVRPTSGRPAN